LAELAADKRASTPTNAAEIVVPKKEEFLTELNYKIQYLENQLNFQLQTKYSSVHNSLDKITIFLADQQQKINLLLSQLTQNTTYYFSNLKNNLDQKITLLNSYSPLKVLDRGYTITFKNGQAISSTKQLKPQDKLTTKFSDGQIESKVI